MSTAIPETVPAASVPADAPTYDVVVVGFGIAGGCAALEAARAGARVLLMERAAVHGGTSSLSGGHFYLGGGTAVQKATGHEDSAEEMYKYLMAVSRDPEPDKVRLTLARKPASRPQPEPHLHRSGARQCDARLLPPM